MLQSNVAWYQLISCHPASCIDVCWGLDDPDPFPQGPPIPQGGAGYHCSIYILNLSYFPFVILFDLVFKFMILTFIIVTYFSIHACLAWNQLSSSYFSIHQHSSSYPTSYIAVGWRLDDPHPFPVPTHSTGGRGGWWFMTMTMAGGVGGDPEPGTYICTCLLHVKCISLVYRCQPGLALPRRSCILESWQKFSTTSQSMGGGLPEMAETTVNQKENMKTQKVTIQSATPFQLPFVQHPFCTSQSVAGLSAWSGTNGWRPRYWDINCQMCSHTRHLEREWKGLRSALT